MEEKSSEIKRVKDLRLLSLFSGCGGMDIGFEGDFSVLTNSINKKIHAEWIKTEIDEKWSQLQPTRFNTVFANDIRECAKLAWMQYFSKYNKDESIYHVESIVDIVRNYHQGLSNIFPDAIDIVTGGFPCQDFSVAGKREGLNSRKSHRGDIREIDEPSIDSRGQLYMWMRDVISIVKPKVFIAENVKGLVNLSDVKLIIEHDFADACDGGYLVVPGRILHSADFGISQNRERVFFFGFKKSELTKEAFRALSMEKIPEKYDPYPPKTHRFTDTNNTNNLEPFVHLFEYLCDLDEPEKSNIKDQQMYSHARFMGKHCQGQNEVNLDSIAPTIRSEHHGNIEFRRLSLEHGGRYREELSHGFKERRLTIRECARIQTFPDEYDFVSNTSCLKHGVSTSEAYKLIGNAVPPLLAFHIAMNLQNKWNLYFSNR